MTELRTRIADIAECERLSGKQQMAASEVAMALYAAILRAEAAEKRIERMEAIVAAARALVADEEAESGDCMISCNADRDSAAHSDTCSLARAHDTLAALDATLGTSPDTQSSAPNRVRPCPSAVSFCGGPDRYGDTCATCLATWTEEAKG